MTGYLKQKMRAAGGTEEQKAQRIAVKAALRDARQRFWRASGMIDTISRITDLDAMREAARPILAAAKLLPGGEP